MFFWTKYKQSQLEKKEEKERQILLEEIKKTEDEIKNKFRLLFMSITQSSEEFLFKKIENNYSIQLENEILYTFKRISKDILEFEVNTNYSVFKSFSIKLELLLYNNQIWSHDASFVRMSGKTWQEYYKDLIDFKKNQESLNLNFLNHIDLVKNIKF
jgi:hypothetical protein